MSPILVHSLRPAQGPVLEPFALIFLFLPVDMAMPPILTVAADCLLTGIDFALEQELKDRLTIENPQYNAAKRYGRWIGKKLKPQLKYYEPVPGGLAISAGICQPGGACSAGKLRPDPGDHRSAAACLPEIDFHFPR